MKKLTIIGSFISNYSLARVNRGLALALSDLLKGEYEVKLYREKDKIDRWPSDNDLKEHPEINELWAREFNEIENSNIIIYNDFPKAGYTKHGLKDLPGEIKLMYLAWEESVYPEMWVDEINENLHGMLVASSFVRNVLRDAGVKVPIAVALNGIDKNVLVEATGKYPLKTKKSFKFLNVSSARKRKGIDILIKAYFKEFNKEDDVCLVIKSFPGPDNLVNELLNELQTENSPEVEHIFNSELTDQELANLTASCDCAVYPTRAEGFGIPIAEAMFHRTPVIATRYSAYLDFIDDNSGFLIDYKLTDALDSELVNVGAKWAEADSEELREVMRKLYTIVNSQSSIGELLDKAYNRATQLTWKNSAISVAGLINEVENVAHLKTENIGVVGRINSEDGLSEYTSYLYNNIENSFKNFYYIANKDIDDRVRDDANNVIRNWNTGEKNFTETLKFVKEKSLDIVHIQYHSGFNFSIQALDEFITNLKALNIEVVVTLHAVKSDSFDFIKESKALNLADKVIIHNEADFNHAAKTLDNVVLFTIPILNFKNRDRNKLKDELNLEDKFPIIISHGLMNHNKNIPTLVEIFSEIKKEYPKAYLILANAVSTNNLASSSENKKTVENMKRLRLEKSVSVVPDFLSVAQIEILMQVSDLVMLIYIEVGETSSDAVRKAICSNYAYYSYRYKAV
ncbi:MAG: glycosyltransferase [Candidatus Dojkabacteria bacterium]|nr:glycosyltransferase [Candidatus Dojkabacteria bacterium]